MTRRLQPGNTLLGVSTRLRIGRSVLKRWVDKTREGRYEPTPGKPLKSDSQAEREALKRELARVKIERDILKILLQRQLPGLGVQRFDIDRRLARRCYAAEHVGRSLQQLAPPVGHLARVHVVLLRDLGNRLLALDCLERHLGLEHR